MNRLNCKQTKDDLKAFLDHELTPLRRWAVSRHVAVCDDCQKELKEMVQVAEQIKSKSNDNIQELDKQQLAAAMASAVPTNPKVARTTVQLLARLSAIGALILCVAFVSLRLLGGTAQSKLAYVGTTMDNDSRVAGSYQSAPAPSVSADSAPIAATRQHFDEKQPTAGVANAQMSPAGGMNSKASDQPVASPALPGDESGYDAGRQVHKSATITVQVKDPESVGEQVENTAKAAGGFVTTSDLTTANDGTKSYTMTVKVPLPQFEATLTQISKLGSVQDKEVTGEDITAQVSDADSREQVLEDDMNQALDQLKKKGSHASWDLQQDARDLRIQLAQSRARLQLLRSLAELSEIDVTLAQPPKPVPAVQSGFFADLTNSGHGALQAASGALVTLIALLLWILAYSPLWIPTLLVGRWLWRRYGGDSPKSEAPTQS